MSDMDKLLKKTSPKPKSFHYIITGDPIPYIRQSALNKSWNDYKRTKLIGEEQLKEQLKPEHIFKGPVHLEATFYVSRPPTAQARFRLANRVTLSPLISFLLFLQGTCANILSLDEAFIISLSSKKVYDDVPRTEFTITEIVP